MSDAGRDRKLLPYKVAVTLLFGYVPGLERVTADQLVLDTSQFAAHLGIPNSRLRQYLTDLEHLGVVSQLTLGHGWARVTVAHPEGFSPTPQTIDVESK